MLLTVEGIYRNGKVEIKEKPENIKQANVLVTFLTPDTTVKRRLMHYGQFSGKRMSTEKDFLIAEWHGELDEYEPK